MRAGRKAHDLAEELRTTYGHTLSAAFVYDQAIESFFAGYDAALFDHRVALVAAALTGGHEPREAVRIADETIQAMKEAP